MVKVVRYRKCYQDIHVYIYIYKPKQKYKYGMENVTQILRYYKVIKIVWKKVTNEQAK